MSKNASEEPGSDLLLLSLRMRCLAEASKRPANTFFRFVTLFYESGCMVVADEKEADSGNVKVSHSCVNKLISVFTDDTNAVEKCLWDSFERAGDINSPNKRLSADSDYIDATYDIKTKFKNPSIYIDGDPYNEPRYPDAHFSEDQVIADVCAALF